jgi:DNA-binding response OmpR family regulator
MASKAVASEYRVLVVDDEISVLELMADVLRRPGWKVEASSSPLEGLDEVRRTAFDALILDLYMPELPGMLFHAKLKLFDPELAGRTVFVTGHFSRDALRRDLVAGGRFLLKPFEPDALLDLVARVLPEVPRSRAATASRT